MDNEYRESILVLKDFENFKLTSLYKLFASEKDKRVYIACKAESNYSYYETYVNVGWINIEDNSIRLLLPTFKDTKFYKSLKAVYNAIWRYDDNASIDSIETAKKMIEELKKSIETIETQETEMIETTNNEIVENNITETVENCKDTNNLIDNNTAEKKVIDLKNEIKALDAQAENILDEIDKENKIRRSNNLYMGIYKCNDIQALKLIKMYKQVDEIDLKIDKLWAEIKTIQLVEWKKFCKIEHKKYINNKYQITINKDYKNRIYTNDYQQYIDKAMAENKDIQVCEYIEYNNMIDKTVNRPQLRTIYEYTEHPYINCHKKLIHKVTPHQYGYNDYIDIWQDIDGNIIQLIEYGYDKNNNEIMSHIINFLGTEFITMHNSFGSLDYKYIDKNSYSDTIKIYYDKPSQRGKGKKHDESEIQELFNCTIDKLEKNKSYNYDIEYYKKFYNIA